MDSAFNATVRHAIFVERHKKRTVRRINALLNELGAEIFGRVAESDLEHLTRKEMDSLLASLRRQIKSGYEPITAEIEDTLRQFGAYEGEWQADMLRRTGLIQGRIGVASDADIWSAVNSRPFEGRFLKDWFRGLADGTKRRISEALTQGYVDGRGAVDLARDIRGTRRRKGIMDMSKRGAETMVRTATNHVATAARNRVYAANPEIKLEQWVSVLDHRTTPICQSRDGNLYEKGEGPRPPAHPGCRSTMAPVTDRNRKRLLGRMTYQEWLQQQSKATQEDILGKKRAQLFRDGGLSVDRFVDESGQEYTLDDLRRKDRETWGEVFGE
jgi:SPP1 gp7 family putative phage head morphogenesis protein